MKLFAHSRLLWALAVGAALVLVDMGGGMPAAKAAGQYRAVTQAGPGIPLVLAFDAANRLVVRIHGTLWVEEHTGFVTRSITGLGFGSPTVQKGPPAIVASPVGGPAVVYVDEPGVGLRIATQTGRIIDSATGIEVAAFWPLPGSSPIEPIANEAGDVLIYGVLRGGPLGAGVTGAWIERAAASQTVFHANTTMPGVGAKFGDYTLRELAFENTGRVAAVNMFSGGYALFVFDAPGLTSGRLVARSTAAQHGIGFHEITHVHMANWRLVYHGAWRGIFSETAGVSELVAGEGRPAVGFGPGASYLSFRPESTAMNSRGDIAFVGEVADPALPGGYASALWIDAIDRPVELALNLSELLGTTAPGSGQPRANHVVMNDSGQIAFMGNGSEGGLWWYDADTGPQRVARVGDQILVDVGGTSVVKTIEDIRIGDHPASGLSTAPYLSDDGEVVFFANFTDSSGAILIWSPVPEPASLVLAAWLAWLAEAVARRRRARDGHEVSTLHRQLFRGARRRA